MSDTDERMEKVFRRASRIQRRRKQAITPVLSVLAVMLGVGLMGSINMFSGIGADISVSGLYGSSLMLGSDVGNYIIVALLAAAFAVVLTLFCVNRSQKNKWHDTVDTFEKDERHD